MTQTQNERAAELFERRIAEGQQYRSADSFAGTDDDKLVVEGYATTFDDPYLLYSEDYDGIHYEMWEQIDSRAFDDADMSDVILQFDHCGAVYARTRNNTLQLDTDAHGLHTRADLSKASDGPKLYHDIKNRLIDRMSWRFTIADEKREVTEDANSYKILRTITRVSKVFDVSAVSIPANDATGISARSALDGVIKAHEAERLERVRKEQARKRLALRIKTGGYLNGEH